MIDNINFNQNLIGHAEPVVAEKMILGEGNIYKSQYKSKSQKVLMFEPLADKSFKQTEELDFDKFEEPSHFLSRLISLPNGRLFVIGGANDI